ncbi:hypothetical protein NQ317_009782 [Molorchus minor]|uniref:Tyr recombinase domain-containing protein n=1 Tax=Molorchus minor TaxID=1323400 RepID=A0ABQ9IRZ5_9CUCU|nr:hypothetical protein NQ317_009782 [Molorchus minor]
MALVTGHRIQTLSLISIKNIIESESGLQIFIPDAIKTSGTGRTQPCMNIPFFHDNPRLCIASSLKQYLNYTKTIRDNKTDSLFLTYRKPYRRATKQTLSRWIKEALHAAGIDTSTFKPHSTRHAASSMALRQGVSIDVISRTVGWTKKSTCFARFYNRPLSTSHVFATSIMKH